MTKTTEPEGMKDWRSWSYSDWNSKLINYYFTVREGESSSPVEQLPATPHELVAVTGDLEAPPDEVVNRFVSVLKKQLPAFRISFCGFCTEDRGWKTDSDRPPHFFAMLWLTCLVAYGYPDGHPGNFHERMFDVFERQQHLECLPELWLDLQKWTSNRASADHVAKRFRRLVLPPRDNFRTVIGASWFLAFPHDHDRSKLRQLLEDHDLVGEEPPLRRVVKLLADARYTFSGSFGQDLDNFVQQFVTTDKDVRNSAFWRAVRQEALAAYGGGRNPRAQEPNAGLMAYYNEDDDLLVPYVACAEDATLPAVFSKTALGFSHNGFSCLVLRSPDQGALSVEQAVAAAVEGTLPIPRASLHYRRGVMIFKLATAGEYELVGGLNADRADMALVRNDLAATFVEHYGGTAEPAYFEGWRQIGGCRVRIAPDAPRGLEGIPHLQATMASPTVRIVGGIRGDDGFVALPGLLPRVRFDGATRVEIRDPAGRVVPAARAADSPDEWLLPDHLVAEAPGRFSALVHWPSTDGAEHTSTCEFTLGNRQVRHDYKSLGAGVYVSEGPAGDMAQLTRDDEIPSWIAGDPLDASDDGTRRPDEIESLPDVVYLAPRLGDMNRKKTAEHDWLVLGDPRRPSLLLFVGDPRSPAPREPRKSPHSKDRSIWRKAVHRSRRVEVRVEDGRIESLDGHPEVRAVLSALKTRDLDHADQADASIAGLDDSLTTTPWVGVAPSPRTSELVDALAALACRRSGMRLSTTVDLFGRATGLSRFDRSDTLYELLRSWVEAGTLDVVHARGQPVSYVMARRPGFVTYRVGSRFRAALIGLLPSLSVSELERHARRRGALVETRHGANVWQPPVVQIEVDDLAVLRELTREFELAPSRWFEAPFKRTPHATPAVQATRSGSDPAYVREKVWDWKSSRFLKASSGTPSAGIHVEMRRHPRRCPVYVIRQDGQDVAWSELRNVALIRAYHLKYGDLPFSDDPSEPVVRTWADGIYLPVHFGRLCAVLGAGLSGPSIDASGKVLSYAYPLFGGYRETLSEYLNPTETLVH
ncbi:hypothetical protein Dcar01_01824 [Deinococcus carri]|uniref:Uncharacterized protein n=1 Tax=Deinococcus carri TaxID=1211323 RepID=A0ABP9WAQ0_9DEIO